MTVSEFLDWEDRQDLRWEFDGFAPVAMTGGTDAHEAIGGTLRAMLHEQLRGKPCKVRGPTMKIEAAGRIRYPDALVYCGPLDRKATVVKEPVVVFEVLSPSTERTDRMLKLREYQAAPSIQRYIILESDAVEAWVFARRGGDWIVQTHMAGETLAMPEIEVEMALSDVYADAGLDAPAG
jgi:Uma2 family endonuclease